MLKGDLVITAVSLAIENSSVVFLLDKLNACFSAFSFMAKEGSLAAFSSSRFNGFFDN